VSVVAQLTNDVTASGGWVKLHNNTVFPTASTAVMGSKVVIMILW
jgi:hypothetical protein